MNLAFKYVMIAAMLAEINFIGAKLDLPIQFPVSDKDLQYTLVAPIWMKSEGGRLNTDKFAFSFSDRGRLIYIWKLKPFGNLSIAQRNDMLVRQKSIISTNDAYRMASNWLATISVDVHDLEKTHAPEVRQEFRWNPESLENGMEKKDFLPLFKIKWGDWQKPIVEIEIDGRTKELLDLRLKDDSVSQRPAALIKDREKLISINDEQFRDLSAAQREALVREFSAIEYPSPKPDAIKR